MKKCPPGVICFENFTIFIIIILLFGVCYFLFKGQRQYGLNQNINIYDKDNEDKNSLFKSILNRETNANRSFAIKSVIETFKNKSKFTINNKNTLVFYRLPADFFNQELKKMPLIKGKK
jgi:hypothetical protein